MSVEHRGQAPREWYTPCIDLLFMNTVKGNSLKIFGLRLEEPLQQSACVMNQA
jgi:hypothetical protein